MRGTSGEDAFGKNSALCGIPLAELLTHAPTQNAELLCHVASSEKKRKRTIYIRVWLYKVLIGRQFHQNNKV